MKIIEKDSKFFAKCGIIDYSLLVGVHELQKHNQVKQESVSDISLLQSDNLGEQMSGRPSISHEQRKKFYEQNLGGLKSIDSSKVYFMGIIDIFTGYNAKKKAEHFLKSIKYDSETISCVPPDQYAKRFSEFIDKAL